MKTYLYEKGLTGLMGSTLWKSAGDTIKLVLMTSSYSFDQYGDSFYADLSNEISPVGGYTSGGVALTLITPSADTTNHVAKLDANDLTITGLVTTFAKGALINTSVGSSPLICYIDFGGNISPAGDYTFVWNDRGILDFASLL